MGVDQGTTGTTVLLLDEDWNLAASSHKEHKQYYPAAGLGGTRSERILAQIKEAAEEVMEKAHVTAEQVECMGIDNQGETVVVWDKVTGEAAYPAIVWQDLKDCNMDRRAGRRYPVYDPPEDRTSCRCVFWRDKDQMDP